MAIKRVDPIDGNDAADGSTWSLAGLPTVGPRKSYVLAGDAAGDEIRWLKTPDPAALGVNATFTDGSPTVSLASAVTANIDMCESLWTASANVTASLSTTIKREGTNANSFAIAAGFVTGKVAYNSFASKNLSTYTHVYCWIYVSVAVAANTLRLDLCSDTAGDTPVNSYTIPYALAAGYFHCITFDNGAALGAAIQSVALIALLDPGAVTVNIDNIIAGTEFGLASVIGKNDGFWWPILSINGTTVTIGCNSGAGTGGTKPYCGTTETVPCYYRYNPQMIFATINLLSSGSAGSLIKYLGGWNSASDTQDGETWLMPSSPSMDGINTNSKGYFRLEEIHVLAPQQGFYFLNTSYCEHHNISVVGGHLKASIYWRSSAGEIIGTGNTKIIGGNQADIGYCGHIWGCEKFTHPGDLYCYGNGYIFYNSDTLADFPGTVDIQRNGSGIRLASRMHIGTLVSKNNIYGVVKGAAHAAVIDNLITSNNTVAACYLDSAIGGEIRVKVGNISEAIAILAYKCSPYESFLLKNIRVLQVGG